MAVGAGIAWFLKCGFKAPALEIKPQPHSLHHGVHPPELPAGFEVIVGKIDGGSLDVGGAEHGIHQTGLCGMDPHEDDPLERSKMSGEFLRERDLFVMETLALYLHIPFFFVLAGGYQEPMEP